MNNFTILNQGGRSEQQDAAEIFSGSAGQVFAFVADGVGGQSGGRLASQSCLMVASSVWEKNGHRADNPQQFLHAYFKACHDRLNEEARRSGQRPRAALAAVVLSGRTLWMGHSGDSRIYVIRGRELIHRTLDHSVVQMLVDRGKITEDQMGLHPDKGRILQCVGGDEFAEPEIRSMELLPTDRVLLCSDGLWERMSRDSIVLAVERGDYAIMDALAREAVVRGKGDADNVSLALINASGAAPARKAFPVGLLVTLCTIVALGAIMALAFPQLLTAFGKKTSDTAAVTPPVIPDIKQAPPSGVDPTPPVASNNDPKSPPPVTPPVTPVQPPPPPTVVPDGPDKMPKIQPTPPAGENPAAKGKRRSRGFKKDDIITSSKQLVFQYAGTDSLYFSKFETRASEYSAFMAERPDQAGARKFEDPDHPASAITVEQALAFARWLTDKDREADVIGAEDAYDLPTDPEWTKAATWAEKGAKFRFPWPGEVFPPSKDIKVGNFADESAQGTVPAVIPGYVDGFIHAAPVGSFKQKQAASPFGLVDLAGNVAEWTVPAAGLNAPPALRGGGWTDASEMALLSATVTPVDPGQPVREDAGFRLVLRIAPPEIAQRAALPPNVDPISPAGQMPAQPSTPPTEKNAGPTPDNKVPSGPDKMVPAPDNKVPSVPEKMAPTPDNKSPSGPEKTVPTPDNKVPSGPEKTVPKPDGTPTAPAEDMPASNKSPGQPLPGAGPQLSVQDMAEVNKLLAAFVRAVNEGSTDAFTAITMREVLMENGPITNAAAAAVWRQWLRDHKWYKDPSIAAENGVPFNIVSFEPGGAIAIVFRFVVRSRQDQTAIASPYRIKLTLIPAPKARKFSGFEELKPRQPQQ